MNIYQISPGKLLKESNTIHQILTNNIYDTSILRNLCVKKKQKHIKYKEQWAKFAYVGKETSAIAKMFKNTNVKAAISTDNTTGKLLATRNQRSNDCVSYQLICPTCNMKYIRQTGEPFKIRFIEHFRDFKYDNKKSRFAQHLLENRHSIGPMDSIMETFHTTNKGRMMDYSTDITFSVKPN
jgi:hypothetical protein